MEQLNDSLLRIFDASIATLRSRINQCLNALGMTAASGTATLLSWTIIVVLAGNILFALNIGIGLLLGELFNSYGLGFLALVGIYILTLILYLICRGRIEAQVEHQVAREVHHITDNINLKLNDVPELQVAPQYRESFISSEPFPYQALRLRYDEATRQAKHAEADLQKGVQYLRSNYQSLFGGLVADAIPAYRYIAPVIDLLDSKRKKEPSPRDTNNPKRGFDPESLLGKGAKAIKPYMPYINTAYTFLRPIVTTVVMSKTQSWILARLLGTKKKKRK